MAPTRDALPVKGRSRFRQRRPSVSIPDSIPLERLDMTNANVSEVSLAPMDPSADNKSEVSVSSSGGWRRKGGNGKPLLFKPPSLRFRSRPESRPEINRPWRRSTHDLTTYPSADETNDSDAESKYSFDSRSSITAATSVASDDEPFPNKSDTPAAVTRTKPFTVEKQVVKARSAPVAPAKPANLRGARINIVAPKKTLHIEVGPVAPAPAPPVTQRITSWELRERERVEDGFLKEISRMREETRSLIGKQSDTDKKLEDALDRISTLSTDKERIEKQRKEERNIKERIARDFEVQSRLLNDVKITLSEHEKKLEDVEKERDELEGVKEQLEAKSSDLERQIALERDAKSEVSSKCAVLENNIAEQQKTTGHLETRCSNLEKDLLEQQNIKEQFEAKCSNLEKDLLEQQKTKEHFEARCSNLEKDLGDIQAVTKETERALIERIAALELTKDSLKLRVTGLETELVRKGTEIGDITAERNLLQLDADKYKPQVDALNKENGALTEINKGLQSRIDDLDEQKKGLETNIEKLETEKKDIQDRFDALEVEKQEIVVRVSELETANTEIQSRIESLEATKGELEVSKGELETQVKDLEVVRTKYDKLKSRIEKIKGQNTTLKSQIGDLLKDQDEKGSLILSLVDERDSLRSENVSLKDENESVTSELRRAESLIGSAAPSVAPSVVSSKAESDAGTVKADDDAPPAPEPQDVLLAHTAEEVKDDAASVKSAAPSQVSRAAPAVESEPEPEAAPAEEVKDDAETEKAESVSATPSEAGVMEELRQRIAELQERNDQLQAETVKLGSLTSERDELAARVATLEPEAAQTPQLRQDNLSLTAQLGAVNAQLDGLRASYEASVTEVNSLQQQIGQLRGRLSSPPGDTSSKKSSRKSKDSDKKREQMVVVRDPNERGRIQIMRRCDLRMMRSASQSEGEKSE